MPRSAVLGATAITYASVFPSFSELAGVCRASAREGDVHRRDRTTCPVQGLCADPLYFAPLSSAALDFFLLGCARLEVVCTACR